MNNILQNHFTYRERFLTHSQMLLSINLIIHYFRPVMRNEMSPFLLMSSLIRRESPPIDKYFRKFISYLVGRSGGGKDDLTAENIARDMSKIFNYVVHLHPKLRSRYILLNKFHLQNYVVYLENDLVLQPSTLMKLEGCFNTISTP